MGGWMDAWMYCYIPIPTQTHNSDIGRKQSNNSEILPSVIKQYQTWQLETTIQFHVALIRKSVKNLVYLPAIPV